MFEANCSDATGVASDSRASTASAASELARDIKGMGAALREMLARIEAHVEEQHIHAQATQDVEEMQRLDDAAPLRWFEDARRSLQAGMMFAVRAVEQPAEF